MTGTPLLAVKATAQEHYALRHPSGDGLDAKGRGNWPDDSFTERRRQDGAIRIVGPADEDDAPAASEPAPSVRKGS